MDSAKDNGAAIAMKSMRKNAGFKIVKCLIHLKDPENDVVFPHMFWGSRVSDRH